MKGYITTEIEQNDGGVALTTNTSILTATGNDCRLEVPVGRDAEDSGRALSAGSHSVRSG